MRITSRVSFNCKKFRFGDEAYYKFTMSLFDVSPACDVEGTPEGH